MRAVFFLVFTAAVLSHRHSLPRSLAAHIPDAVLETRRRVLRR